MEISKPLTGILGCLFASLFSLSAWSHTLEGLPGTPLTPTAQPIGHLGLMVGISAFGHADESMVENGRFLRNNFVTGREDTNEVKDLESGTLRANVAMGVGSHFDLALSLPFHVDYLGETEADELSGFAPGDPTLSAKVGFSAAGDQVFCLALLGSATLPTKSPKGFLPKHSS